METTKHKNYLEPADFFKETLICLNKGEASEKLGMMFLKLAEKYVNHPKFVRYNHIRDDLISQCLLGCCKGFPKFRPYQNDLIRDEQGEILTSTRVEWNGEIIPYDYRTCNNPFAFFTTCATNEILQFLKSEYKFKNVVNKVRLDNGLEADAAYNDMIKEQEQASDADDFEIPVIEEDVYDREGAIEWENGA